MNEIKVNCLSCGHKVDLDEAYGDYEGQVKCWGCGATLEIKTAAGDLKSVRLANLAAGSRAGENRLVRQK
jgi:hypothetical protein